MPNEQTFKLAMGQGGLGFDQQPAKRDDLLNRRPVLRGDPGRERLGGLAIDDRRRATSRRRRRTVVRF
jgi:hypothetical protein